MPVLCVLGGVLLSFLTIAIDRASGGTLIPQDFTGDPNAALMVLSTAAASMVSLTALVLTITMVVVQLAMGQFSPRSVRPFLRDRPSQLAIGIFAGTFAHAMLAMREVRSFEEPGLVPGVSILTSFGLILVSIAVLIAYVHHIANSLKVDSIIRSVGDETRRALDKLYPPDGARAGSVEEPGVIAADRAGLISRVDSESLVAAATSAGSSLELLVPVGTFVPQGAPLFSVTGDGHRIDRDAIRKAVAIGAERTMDQDAAFGLQTLVDVAERSLSDSFNDATTAAQALDRIHDCLRLLVTRPFPSGQHHDERGELRLTVPVLDWADYVAIAFDSLLLAARQTPPVLDRAREALNDLKGVAPPDRVPPLDARLQALDAVSSG